MPKLQAAAAVVGRKGTPKSIGFIRAWLEKQDAYTLHRPAKKRFAHNPYTVTNVMDVWECDLLDVQAYAKYNDNYKYILSVIDIFSKFLFLVPVKTKSGPAVTTVFLSIFDGDPKKHSCRPVWVRTDKSKEFYNNIFRTYYATRAYNFRFAGTPT